MRKVNDSVWPGRKGFVGRHGENDVQSRRPSQFHSRGTVWAENRRVEGKGLFKRGCSPISHSVPLSTLRCEVYSQRRLRATLEGAFDGFVKVHTRIAAVVICADQRSSGARSL